MESAWKGNLKRASKEGAGAWRRNVMEKKCMLDDARICADCGECLVCDLDSSKRCDNCMRCVQKSGADYLAIEIDEVIQGTSTDE